MVGFEFDFHRDRPAELILELDAYYPPETHILRLTNTNDHHKAVQNSTGRVHYSPTVPFGPKAKFNTKVIFTINPNNDDTCPAGDGLAFFIVNKDHKFPNAIGNLGLFDESREGPNVFAVALDLDFKPDQVILAVDLQKRDPETLKPVLNEFIGKELTLTVTYDGSDFSKGKATVTTTADSKLLCEVPFSYDLSHFLKSNVQVGLASSTSDRVAVHDVHYWDFTSSVP